MTRFTKVIKRKLSIGTDGKRDCAKMALRGAKATLCEAVRLKENYNLKEALFIRSYGNF